ncbi:MAG: hypothetical protein K2K76_10320 [Muribaculaceae bacterium]|nr:hypothetical protein [Muribaculaceae bacterium]
MELPIQLLQQGIQRGSILLSDSFDDIDHAKFFAVIGVSQDAIAGFFFINSRIHSIIMAKPRQLAMQYQLKKSDYDFLRYDSFLGANELQIRPVAALIKSMQEGQTSIVGQLTDEDLILVLEACRNSSLFSEKEKLQFFY